MDKTLLTILFFLLLSIVFIVVFLVTGIKKSNFVASDGTIFQNQSDLDVYQKLLEKTKILFTYDQENLKNQLILGFDTSFFNKIRTEGFKDLKTIVKYRKQFEILSELINK